MTKHIGDNRKVKNTAKKVFVRKTRLNIWMGRRLRELRINAGISIEMFATELKISTLDLIEFEKGHRSITNQELFDSSKLIGISIVEFFPIVNEYGQMLSLSEYYNEK